MLKKIIKRNGSIEDFIPEKMNKWSRWASEDISNRVNWSEIVLNAVKNTEERMTSQVLQQRLIDACLDKSNWPHQIMAGRLFASTMRKKIFGSEHMPKIRKLHSELVKKGLMVDLGYNELEYEELEKIIDHNRDFSMAHFQLEYIRHKYSLQNRFNREAYETPQYIYIRIAMAVLAKEEKDKLRQVKELYDHLSFNRINAPTPNYTNLGTPHAGLSSCCLYTAGDSASSLAIGDHIAYTQTYMSAGIGANLNIRSLGNSIRNGVMEHQGKLPYYAALGKAVRANKQGSRGGACTVYFSVFDFEVMTIIMLQNPKSPEALRNRDIHYAIMTNKLFAERVAMARDIFLFNVHTAPDLTELFYSNKQDEFKELYCKYENDTTFQKTVVPARDICFKFSQQFYDVATLYHISIDEINRHTPFKESIYSSNLCLEITEPTKAYDSMLDLYSTEDHNRGEVALCTLAGIVEPNISTDEEYESVAYYCLKMIDECIDLTKYALPHIELTAKKRRNAAVGLVGTAVSMARSNLKYDSQDGLNYIHRLAEKHSYYLIKAALRLGREKGNAEWMEKTRWPDGWLPIDTYKKAVDTLVTEELHYDWESLRNEIIENKGIRFSSLIAHMPTESSSKASGVPNSIYPIRNLNLKKTDGGNVIEWCATDDDILGDKYQIAWSIKEIDLIKYYAVVQKFTDHSISADMYRDRSEVINITNYEILDIYLNMVKYGLKTKYYTNSLTSKDDRASITDVTGCSSGTCTL